MGMFDDIVCKYQLPLPEDPKGYCNNKYQTKDFDNAMDLYEIREDGTLWLRCAEYEYTDGNPKGKTLIDKLPTRTETRVWWQQIFPITDTVRLYAYDVYTNDKYDYWIEYDVTFVDGKVTKAKLLEFTATDNSARKEQHRKDIEYWKNRRTFEKTLFYRLFGKYYNRSISFVCRRIHVAATWVTYKIWKVEKFLKL
jgi:hypothetical protein